MQGIQNMCVCVCPNAWHSTNWSPVEAEWEDCEAINTDWRWRDWRTDKIDSLYIYIVNEGKCAMLQLNHEGIHTHKSHIPKLKPHTHSHITSTSSTITTTSLTISFFCSFFEGTFNLVRIMIIAKLQQMHAPCISR